MYKYACFKFFSVGSLYLKRVLFQEKNVDNPMKQSCISVILLQLYIKALLDLHSLKIKCTTMHFLFC